MPENERSFTPDQINTITDKVNQAIDADTPTVHVQRGDGSIEGGWLPYATTIDDSPDSEDRGEAIIHLAKIREDGEGYDLKSVYKIDLDAVNDEVKEIDEAAEKSPDKEGADRIRAVRMSSAYRTMQERFRSH